MSNGIGDGRSEEKHANGRLGGCALFIHGGNDWIAPLCNTNMVGDVLSYFPPPGKPRLPHLNTLTPSRERISTQKSAHETKWIR